MIGKGWLILGLLWTGSVFGSIDDIEWHGFWDTRLGQHLSSSSEQDDLSLAQMTFRMDLFYQWDRFEVSLKNDLLWDHLDHSSWDIETGSGGIDLREFQGTFYQWEWMDIKIGRQILTWGTGDLIFINDLFPKDWNAFLLGRDLEYLKAPTDAVKIGVYHEWVNLDIVWVPVFDSDRFVDGDPVVFYNPLLQRVSGDEIDVIKPNDLFEDSEIHLRANRRWNGYEWAIYGYHGFWNSPSGLFQKNLTQFTFHSLNSYGASVRGSFLRGIINFELGHYLSEDDAGTDPLIRNNEFRFLMGYEQELIQNLTLKFQYYLEQMLDYEGYVDSVVGENALDELRHVLTLRATQLFWQQTLKFSSIIFFSPTDQDCFLKSDLTYQINDSWQWNLGLNWFYGESDRTFYAQFENNSNLYTSLRLNF